MSFKPLRFAGLALALAPGSSWADEVGLPQKDFSTYPSQLFWLAVFFIIVYLFMRFVGIPRVEAILKERQARIGGDLDQAEQLRKVADKTLKAYEATLAQAHGKARKLVAETHEKNVAALTERTRAAAAEFDKRVGDAVERIDAAQTSALRGIAEVAQGLAADITTKLSGRKPTPENVARAVGAAAASRGTA